MRCLVLLHVALAFWLVAGFVGRNLTMALTVFAQGRSFTGSGNWWFLTSLILYLALIPLVPIVFLPRGRIFERAPTEARQRGEVTTELSAALRDPAVAAARVTELVVVAVILLLMVVKPF